MLISTHPRSFASRALALALVVMAIAVVGAAFAGAASAAVEWKGPFYSAPTNMAPDSRGGIQVWPGNAGDTMSDAMPTTTIELPPGVTFAESEPFWICSGASTVTCDFVFPFPITPYSYAPIPLSIVVNVAPGAAEGTFDVPVTMSGGGAAGPVTQTGRLTIDDQPAGFGVLPDSFEAGTFADGGGPFVQAGGHPDTAQASFRFNTRFNDPASRPGDESAYVEMVQPVEPLKDVVVDIPAGFVGNPTAGPTCPDTETLLNAECPSASQVGVATYDQKAAVQNRMAGIYNMEPDADHPAQFALAGPAGPVTLIPMVRSDGDWGISVKVRDISEGNPIFASSVTLWGTPAEASHDDQRCARPNELALACVGVDTLGVRNPDQPGQSLEGLYDPSSSTAPENPFLANPTECPGTPETTRMHVSSWAAPGPFETDGDPDLTDTLHWKSATAEAPALEGCEALAFDPTLDIKPTSTAPDSPTGLDVDISVPQNDDPIGVATAHLRDTAVVLPEGMRVNPSSARGLAACSSAQIGLTSPKLAPVHFTRLEPSCPKESKIGAVEIDTPLLDDPIEGSVYLAAQKDNPFDSLLSMYIVVRGPGILGKLAGHIQADPKTGQLTTTVLDNPQVPFDSLHLTIKGGAQAPLTTPQTCGPKTATANMTSWAGHDVALSDTFQIDCPGTSTLFDPGFTAGTTNPVAGGSAPIVARMTRDTGKDLGRLDLKLPKGLLAKVRDVAVCGEAQLAGSTLDRLGRTTQAASSCPSASQVGTVTVGAGSGPEPFFPTIPGTAVTGRIFLTGAHAGTQFPIPGGHQTAYGLAVEVPAVAGPFDLGTVLVRVAIYADPRTAELTAVSDRLPAILQGIPLDVRDVRAKIDRAGFGVNPTSCAEKRIVADIRAQDETLAQRSARFQVGDCAALGLKPRMSMRLIGRKQTKTGGNPALRLSMRQPAGQANLGNVRVRLPLSLALDARNAAGGWLCSYENGLEGNCPASSRIGTATAYSPLLKRRLTGPVYFAKNVRIDPTTKATIRTLPVLVFKLAGEADVLLRATSSVPDGKHLVSTISGIPDAAVSRFDLRIKGGNSRGILAVTGESNDLCDGSLVAKTGFRGQNGKSVSQNVRMKTPCAAKKAKRRK